jgi:hypothetical protein
MLAAKAPSSEAPYPTGRADAMDVTHDQGDVLACLDGAKPAKERDPVSAVGATGATAETVADLIGSGSFLMHFLHGGSLDRVQIRIEQGAPLVAILGILSPQADHLADDLHVEAG